MKKARILLVYTSEIKEGRKVDAPIVAPIGLYMINGYLIEMGYEVKILDIITVQNNRSILECPDEVLRIQNTIEDFMPDFVGFSFRNLLHMGIHGPKDKIIDHFSISIDKEIMEFMQKITDAYFFGGGSAFSIEPELYMKNLPLDFGITGEGEVALHKCIQALNNSMDEIRGIPGVVLLEGDRIHISKMEYISNLHTMPPMKIDNKEYYKKTYYEKGGYANIQSKRGCCFQCIYCSYPWLEGRVYRYRNVDAIVQEIQYLKTECGAKNFFFVDSVFSTPSAFSETICDAIIQNKLNINWTAYINPHGITKELLLKYKQSGCSYLILTTDSLAEKTLLTYQKGFTRDEIISCIEILSYAQIPYEVQNIMGGPGETQKTVQETIDFCDKYLSEVNVYFQLGIVFYMSPQAKEHYACNPMFKEICATSLSDVVKNNDFSALGKFTYFFRDIIEDRENQIYNILYGVVKKRRIIYADDNEIGNLVYKIIKKKMITGDFE